MSVIDIKAVTISTHGWVIARCASFVQSGMEHDSFLESDAPLSPGIKKCCHFVNSSMEEDYFDLSAQFGGH